MTSLIADLLGRLDPDRRYEFEERAGIIEFENGQPRELAECLALIDLLRSYPGALLGVTALDVRRGDASEFLLTTDVTAARGRLEGAGTYVLSVIDLATIIRERFYGLVRVAEF
jgi:hypothetical protein